MRFLLLCGVVAVAGGLIYVFVHVAAAVLPPRLLTVLGLLGMFIAVARFLRIYEQ